MGLFSSVAGIFAGGQKAKAAKQAASAQVAYDQQGVGTISDQLARTQGSLSPWINGGQAANRQTLDLLGLGGGSNPADAASYVLQQRPDVAGSGWLKSISPSAIGDMTGDGQIDDGDRALYWQKNYGAADGLNLPPGQSAADAQQSAITGLQNSPLYQSLFRNGQNTILANGAATGGLRGGNMQNSLANFGSDTLAKVIQQQLANLGGISTQGQQAAVQSGTFGSNAANNIAGLYQDEGAAQAGGILGKLAGHLQQLGASTSLATQIASAVAGGFGGGGDLSGSISGAGLPSFDFGATDLGDSTGFSLGGGVGGGDYSGSSLGGGSRGGISNSLSRVLSGMTF